MKRYRYDGQGTPLLSKQGQIIKLPFASRNVTAPDLGWPATAGTGLSVLFTNLTSEKYLVTEPLWRLRLTADGSFVLLVNVGMDGSTASAVFTCTKPELATAGVVLTTTRPHFIFIEPVTYGVTRSDGYVFRIWVDGTSIPLVHTDIGGLGWSRLDGCSIGGTLTASFSDFCAFEFFKSFGPHPTAAQQLVLANGGRGVDVQALRFLAGKLFYLARFIDKNYDAGNQWFVPTLATPGYYTPSGVSTAELYSSAFKLEYGDTSRLFFDGLNDFIEIDEPALKLLPAGLDNFTYVMELIPSKPIALPPETGGQGLVTFDHTNAPSIISGWRTGINFYQLVPWLGIGTNGVAFGFTGLEDYGNVVITTLLSHAMPFSATQSVRVAIRVTDRTPQLWINGALKYQGQRTPPQYSPGSAKGDWPWRLLLNFGEPASGFNGNISGTYGGWAKNYRVWDYARTDAQLQSATVPTGSEPGLLVFWPLSRTNVVSGTGMPFSPVIVDRASQRAGRLENYVLSPAPAAYKLRIGRVIR